MKVKELIKPIEQTEWSESVIIRTKQFIVSQSKYDWTEQSGKINYDTLLFTPDNIYHHGRVGTHRVQFHSMFSFLSSLIVSQ